MERFYRKLPLLMTPSYVVLDYRLHRQVLVLFQHIQILLSLLILITTFLTKFLSMHAMEIGSDEENTSRLYRYQF